jgi:hypothetical protein
MMARGFRPVGWVAALGAAALGCYMLSLRVASERADLARLDRKIIAAQQSIRTLQTEVGTRSRIPQLEDWNEEVLALAAPAAGQYVSGHVGLARFDMRAPQLADQGEVRLAAAAPAPHQAAPAPAAPVQRAVAAPAPAAAPPAQVRRASLAVGAPAPAKTRVAAAPTSTAAAPQRGRETAPVSTASREERRRPAAAPTSIRTASAQPQRARPATAVAPRRAAAAAARPARGAGAGTLLDGRTMRELGDKARSERQRGTRD